MAIIKCPECGHQISDKAPVCPNCGVEIAGKVTKCPFCGEVYFNDEAACPHCHKQTLNHNDDGQQSGIYRDNGVNRNDKSLVIGASHQDDDDTSRQENVDKKDYRDNKRCSQGKKNKTTLVLSIIMALIVMSICVYFYYNAKTNNEQNEYEFAMNSNDQEVLQEYLDNFKDAPQEHLDSVAAHLQILLKQKQDWTNAVVSNSKSALLDYLQSYPDSPYQKEALNKIDSIDWEQSVKLNTADAYQMYIDEHSDGAHYEEAVIALKKIKSNEVSLDDELAISNIFYNFFVSINSKDENGLTANIGEYINFLGKQNATKSDIVLFMHKLYKDNVENMTWSVQGSYEIHKKEIGNEQYEYDTTFMAEQKVKNIDGTENANNFRITAKVDPDGKITEMSMTKIIE